jgi:histone acetyltransferase (RNA polymerase elongator complex component)
VNFNHIPNLKFWGVTDVPIGVKEDYDNVNEADILGFTDDDIEF